MRLKFTGNFKALDRWAKKLERAPEAMDEISLQLAEETIDLIREGIADGVDPYGKPYAPLKLRDGQPLRKTGGMQVWQRKAAGRDGFTVASPKKYAIYHQQGTGLYGPHKKPIVPKGGAAAFRRRSRAALMGTGERVGFGKALRIPTQGGAIFRRSVKGTPKRRMVPDRRGPLPSKWRARYVETANEVLTEYFRK